MPHPQVFVSSNQSVQEGDPLVVVEAMKMEHTGGHWLLLTQLEGVYTDFSTESETGEHWSRLNRPHASRMYPKHTSLIPPCPTTPAAHHLILNSSLPALLAVRAPCAGTVAELHSFVDAQVCLLVGWAAGAVLAGFIL